MEGRGVLVYSSVCFPVPTLFLTAPVALGRMITVPGTDSYTIAQTLESPILFQRLFPADWSAILLSNNALNFPFTMGVSIRALRARPTAGPVNQVLWEAKQVWQNRLLFMYSYVIVRIILCSYLRPDTFVMGIDYNNNSMGLEYTTTVYI